jgi:hypothetical protein
MAPPLPSDSRPHSPSLEMGMGGGELDALALGEVLRVLLGLGEREFALGVALGLRLLDGELLGTGVALELRLLVGELLGVLDGPSPHTP